MNELKTQDNVHMILFLHYRDDQKRMHFTVSGKKHRNSHIAKTIRKLRHTKNKILT